MPDEKPRCVICRRSLFMDLKRDLSVCTDCSVSMPAVELPNDPDVVYDAMLWAAKRAWAFATEAPTPDQILVPARLGDPGRSRSRIRRRR